MRKPFPTGKDNPKAQGRGGRQKGTPNKATEVQAALEASFQRCATPEDWDVIIGKVIQRAKAGDIDPLAKIMPYVAKRKDNILEVGDKDGDGKILSVTLRLSE